MSFSFFNVLFQAALATINWVVWVKTDSLVSLFAAIFLTLLFFFACFVCIEDV